MFYYSTVLLKASSAKNFTNSLSFDAFVFMFASASMAKANLATTSLTPEPARAAMIADKYMASASLSSLVAKVVSASVRFA